jgi:hypothetical protein
LAQRADLLRIDKVGTGHVRAVELVARAHRNEDSSEVQFRIIATESE